VGVLVGVAILGMHRQFADTAVATSTRIDGRLQHSNSAVATLSGCFDSILDERA